MSSATTLQVVTLSPAVPSLTPVLHPAAIEAKRVALESARAVTVVDSHESAHAALTALGQCKQLLKLAEESRKELKAPLLDAGRDIDAQVKSYAAELTAESDRLARLGVSFEEAQRRAAEEAQRKVYEAEQERLRQLQLERREVMTDTSHPAAARLAQLDAADAAAVRDIAAIRQTAAQAVVPSAPAGTQLRKDWKFEVTDIHALYKAHPELCTIEPNNAAIRAVIKTRDLPGVRRWQDAKVSIRTASTTASAVVDQYDY